MLVIVDQVVVKVVCLLQQQVTCMLLKVILKQLINKMVVQDPILGMQTTTVLKEVEVEVVLSGHGMLTKALAFILKVVLEVVVVVQKVVMDKVVATTLVHKVGLQILEEVVVEAYTKMLLVLVDLEL